MNVWLRPAGPEPPQVYWTRRLVVLGGAVLVILLAVTLISSAVRRGADDPDTTDPEDETLAGEPPDATDAPASGTRTCTAADLTLVVDSDASSYGTAAQPTLTVMITNTGPNSCAIDAGAEQLELLITSGSDRIWSSLDCVADDAPERLLLLAAGAADSETAVAWTRIRSNAECDSDLPAPRPGWYRAVAKLAGAESEPESFELTG
jgi:hypothetical protein